MKEDKASDLHLRIPSRLEEVAGVGQALREYALARGASSDDADALELAVCEAANNAIQHAYGGHADNVVEIAARADASMITVTVRDRGSAMGRPLPVKGTYAGPIQSSRPTQRGLGLRIIAELMDEVRYESNAGVNALELRKSLRLPGS